LENIDSSPPSYAWKYGKNNKNNSGNYKNQEVIIGYKKFESQKSKRLRRVGVAAAEVALSCPYELYDITFQMIQFRLI
jgi:hypothetical protein